MAGYFVGDTISKDFIENELDALIDVSQENIADREDEVNY